MIENKGKRGTIGEKVYTNGLDVSLTLKGSSFTTCGGVVGSHQKLNRVDLNGWTHAPHFASCWIGRKLYGDLTLSIVALAEVRS